MMLNKLLMLIVCTALGTTIGILIMRSFKRSSLYMDSVCAMISELKRNVAYKRDSVIKVLTLFNTESNQLKKNIDEYANYVSSKNSKLQLSRGYLTVDEHKKVCGLFESLGVSDSHTQEEMLNNFSEVFGRYKVLTREKEEKFGMLAVKLGFLFGLGVGILFL